MVASSIVHADEKVILVTSEWIPYTSETMKGGGMVTEIVSAAFKESGLDIEYQFVPWLRAEEYVREGRAYAVFPYVKTDIRKETYDFSGALVGSAQTFFYLKQNIDTDLTWERYEDLKNYKIGGTFGFWYVPALEAAGLDVDTANSDEMGIQKLYRRRFDLFAVDELHGWAIVKKLYPNQVDLFGSTNQALKADDYRLMVSRTYPDAVSITKQFNAGLQRIKRNGVYSAILDKYNISD